MFVVKTTSVDSERYTIKQKRAHRLEKTITGVYDTWN